MVEMIWKGAGNNITVSTRRFPLTHLTEIEVTEEYGEESRKPTIVDFTFHFQHGTPLKLNAGEVTPDLTQPSASSEQAVRAARIADAWNFAHAVGQ